MKKSYCVAIALLLYPLLANFVYSMEEKRKKIESEETPNKHAIVIDASTIPIKQKFGLSTKRQFYAHPSKIVFELWNKLPNKVFFTVSEEKNWPVFDADQVYALKPNHLIALKDDDINISKPHFIYFYNLFKKLQGAYSIGSGKTIFVRIKQDKASNHQFGPQTGSLMGFAGLSKNTRNQTDTGLSKDNNVTEEDIVRLEFSREATSRRDRQKTPESLTPETMTKEWAYKFIGIPEWAGEPEIKATIKYLEEKQKEQEGKIDPDISAQFNALLESARKKLLEE